MKPLLDNELRQKAEYFIRQRVAMGFDDALTIHGAALDYLDGECDFDVLEPYLGQLTRDLLAEHCEAQASWPAETDCDRLDFAFLVLEEEEDIIACQNFTCCQTDGHNDIWSEIRDVQSREPHQGAPVKGYVFYHEQDTESAVESGTLYLAYGAVGEGEDAARGVANRVVQVLREAGLEATWTSNLRQRILVKVDWKRRRECG